MIHSTTLWVLLSIVLPLASLSFLVAATNSEDGQWLSRMGERITFSLISLVCAVGTCVAIAMAVSS